MTPTMMIDRVLTVGEMISYGVLAAVISSTGWPWHQMFLVYVSAGLFMVVAARLAHALLLPGVDAADQPPQTARS
jgi:hypothetical protein